MIISDGNLDWEAIANQLIQENEQLRTGIVRLRNETRFTFDFDLIKDFVQENYLVIIAALYALSLIIDIAFKWRSRREE